MAMWIKKNDIENIKRVVEVIGLVGAAIDTAAPYVKEYAPKIADAAVDGAKAVGDVAGKAGKAVAEKAPGIVQNANIKRKDLVSHINKINADRKEKKKVLESEKSEKEIVTTIIEDYGTDIKVAEFIKNYELLPDEYLTEGGCYAIFTLPAMAKKVAKFDEVFVGVAPSMGEDIYKNLMGLGNVDVYSDMKAKKNMRIAIYPCLEEDANALYQSLIHGFNAYESYNKWDMPIEINEVD